MLLLTACGGGGGGSAVTVPVPADVFPTSGNYAYALKAGGSTTNPTVGLSLIHPLERSAEYQIETVSANLTDVKLIYSGTVSPATQSVSGVLPTALLYITGGDAKRLPLLANGNSPKTNVQAAGATGLCKITLEANDYAAPFDSKYMATTKGPDGLCGTADDGQARIEFTATGKPVVSTSFPEGPLLGIFRELETLKPNSEIYGARIRDNSPSHPLLCIMGVDTTASMTKVVSQAPDVVVAERYGKLVVWTNACRETELNAAVTAGTGWETIGFDATDFYVYQNSGKTTSSTWKIVKISRTSFTATTLASGTGYLPVTPALGTNFLYATANALSGFSLLRFAKLSGSQTVVAGPSINTVTTLFSSVNGVHLMWRVTANGTTSSAYQVDILNEATGAIVDSYSGALLLGVLQPGSIDLKRSENRSQFLFTSGAYATSISGYGGANLIRYDTAASPGSRAKIFGTVPTGSDLGSTTVSAGVSAESSIWQAGYVAGINGGTLAPAQTKTFSVDFNSINSFQLTTVLK